MPEFSDYIVYVDESGDHSLTSIDADFPVFSLSFCVVKKEDYLYQMVPAMQALKFKYWGHDSVVLHEHEIRKSKGDFTFLLTDRALREQFYEDLNQVMVDAPITIIASVIDKVKLTAKYANPWSPYDLALHFCLERLQTFLRENGQEGRLTHVVFECRGKAEDDDLELTFRRIVAGEGHWGYRKHKFEIMEFEPKFAKKSVNSTGLQLADLTARPLALRTLRPGQSNRFGGHHDQDGCCEGVPMTQKSKRAPVSQHPVADQVIPNPWVLCRKLLSKLQTFWQQAVRS